MAWALLFPEAPSAKERGAKGGKGNKAVPAGDSFDKTQLFPEAAQLRRKGSGQSSEKSEDKISKGNKAVQALDSFSKASLSQARAVLSGQRSMAAARLANRPHGGDRRSEQANAVGKLPTVETLDVPISGLYLLAAPSSPTAASAAISPLVKRRWLGRCLSSGAKCNPRRH
jgi:hypothetical protein